VPLICRILIEACAGLDYAHKRTDPTSGRPLGIVHRDVSPQNILVTFEGGVKVVDFGIAKAADQATITRSGVLKGKYSYMSPEQSNGLRVDCRSDIFALGVVLYELLTGARLFKRANDIQTLTAVSECRVLPPSHVTTRVPADLDAIVLKALAKDPAERYQEAAQLQAALEGWLSANRLPGSAAHLAAYMKELYAERLAEEALTGEVLVGEPQEPGLQPASRRSGLRPALPPRPPPSEVEDATDSVRSAPPKTARFELEPEKPQRVTGTRRALEPSAPERVSRAGLGSVPVPPRAEPAPSERASRGAMSAVPVPPAPSERASRGAMSAVPVPPAPSERASRAAMSAVPPVTGSRPGLGTVSPGTGSRPGLGAVSPGTGSRPGLGTVPMPPPVEEDAPTLDGRAPRATLTDVKLAVDAPPVPERAASRGIPQGGDEEEEEPTLDGRAIPRASVGPRVVEEDGPTLAMPEPPPSAWSAPPLTPAEDPEEDAPTLSLGMSRPARKDTSTTTAAVNLGGRSRPAWLVPAVGLVAAVGLGLGVWLMVRPSGSAPESAGAAPQEEARAPQVRFMADPWAEVTCGGKRLGQTPFETQELRVGTYDCTFFNPQLQKTVDRRIEVKPGGLNVSVKFE
jgi:hypothetical protein